MHDKMIKMLMSKKKEGKTLSDSEKKSKLQALSGMRDMASQMMGDKLKNLKKVTVASDSKSGLKKGLGKAEDLLDKSPDMNQGGDVAEMPSEFDKSEEESEGSGMSPADAEESSEHEASESPEFEAGEQEESMEKLLQDSPNDEAGIDELIKKLEEKKQQLSK